MKENDRDKIRLTISRTIGMGQNYLERLGRETIKIEELEHEYTEKLGLTNAYITNSVNGKYDEKKLSEAVDQAQKQHEILLDLQFAIYDSRLLLKKLAFYDRFMRQIRDFISTGGTLEECPRREESLEPSNDSSVDSQTNVIILKEEFQDEDSDLDDPMEGVEETSNALLDRRRSTKKRPFTEIDSSHIDADEPPPSPPSKRPCFLSFDERVAMNGLLLQIGN